MQRMWENFHKLEKKSNHKPISFVANYGTDKNSV